jgi:ribosomal protein L37AE/L43A
MSKTTQFQKLGKLTVGEFFARFPDDDACLIHIMEVRYGQRHVCAACGVEGTFHKLANRRAFSCAHCGDHVYPTAGTIFQDTRTPLQVWFYAIYLFVTTRHGVSGKELERALGVTYKTAWRMGQQIRQLMAKADSFEEMQGHVEIDEAYVGGYRARTAVPARVRTRRLCLASSSAADALLLRLCRISRRIRFGRLSIRTSKPALPSLQMNRQSMIYSRARGTTTKRSITARRSGVSSTIAAMNITTRIALKASGGCLKIQFAARIFT